MNSQYENHLNWLSQFYDREKISRLGEQQIQQLYQLTQPKSVSIAQLENLPTDRYLVNSPDGYVPVRQWRNKGVKDCVKIITESGLQLTASEDHLVEMDTGLWKYSSFVCPGERVKTINGNETVISQEPAGSQEVYDFHIGHENHRYYTNSISSHNSGGGKSLFLANLGVNWALMGLNVIYLTFELSENLVSMRLDSMTTGISTREIFRQIDDVELKVKMLEKRSGHLQIKYMPSGKNCNDIRAYLKEYQVKTGKKPDVLLIDYLDLMMPISVKVSPSDLFVKDKYVSEEIRNLAMETQCITVTASQLNRSAVEEIEFDHSHISGGLSKIMTADNVIGIFTSRAMKERGRYQIQFMKTRSSSGVGQKVDLEFNIDTLRINDLDEDQEPSFNQQKTTNSVVDSLKRTSIVSTATETKSVDPKSGSNFKKSTPTVPTSAPLIRSMLSALNPEKD